MKHNIKIATIIEKIVAVDCIRSICASAKS